MQTRAFTSSTRYRDIIRLEFLTRNSKNKHYTLSAFARDMDLDVPHLQRILKGKKGLSLQAAQKIAKRMGLSTKEIGIFSDLVESEHARSIEKRQSAKNRIKSLPPTYHPISDEFFRMISEWHHLALLALTDLNEFRDDPDGLLKNLESPNKWLRIL